MKKHTLRKSNMNTGKMIRSLILILFAISFLLPLYWMLSLSVKDATQATRDTWGLPCSFHPENYVAAWNKIDIPNILKNSFVYTAGGVIICIFCSVMVAYAITRMRMKHENAIRLYFTAGMLVPVAVLLIPVYRTTMSLGLKGTPFALILPYAAFAMTSCVLMLSAFFRSVPREMEEAAAIDGCGVFRTFFSIMIPIVKPALVTQAMLQFISNWNEYALASILALGEKMRTIPVALDFFFGMFDLTNWGVVGAAVTITSLPVIIFFVLCNRQIENAMVGSSGLK